jgi:hypothetical protein
MNNKLRSFAEATGLFLKPADNKSSSEPITSPLLNVVGKTLKLREYPKSQDTKYKWEHLCGTGNDSLYGNNS